MSPEVSESPTRPVWSQVPPLLEVPSPVPLVAPLLITVVPLWYHFTTLEYPPWWHWLMAAVAIVVVIAIDRFPRYVVPVVAAAAVVLVPAYGANLAAHIAPLLFVPLVAWTFALRPPEPPSEPAPRWRPSGLLLYPSCVLLVPVAISLTWYRAFRFSMLCIVGAVALAGLAILVPALGSRLGGAIDAVRAVLDRRVRRPLHGRLEAIGEALGRVAGGIVMLPAAALTMIAWVGHRLFRYDPLQPRGRRRGSAWVGRSGPDPNPARLFSQATLRGDRRTAVSLQRLGANIVSLAVVGLLVTRILYGPDGVNDAVDSLTNAPEACRLSGDDEAMHLDPGWPETGCEILEFERNGRFDATTTYTMADYESRWLHVTDGVRRTWKAPKDCGCRRVRMVMFGGSAAMGWWQRDDYTLASELAKRFWQEDRIALDIELRAMPGWVIGQEVRKFAELSVMDGHQPDLALFYDGGNDLNLQKGRDQEGRGADESEVVFTEDVLDKLLAEGPFPWVSGDFEPRAPDHRGRRLTGGQIGRHALNRYARNVELGRRTAEAAGIEPIFVWQPLSPSAPARVRNTESIDDGDLRTWHAMLRAVLPRLPEGVLDYSDVLDDAPRVVFKDVWHTNELGARIVARQLHDDLLGRVRAAAAEGS